MSVSKVGLAARCFARAEAALATSQLRVAAAAASDGLSALPASSAPPTLQLALLNAQGIALHHLGDADTAQQSLEHALDVALHVARMGAADDNYLGVGGCLIDLAANHLRRGDQVSAETALKRSGYMLSRAYRPSAAASGCLLVVQGLLHEARDEHQAAFDAQQKAHSTLLSSHQLAASGPHGPHIAGWLQAARAGSIWALLSLGKPRAAETLAAADLQRIDGAADDGEWAPREREYARSLAAIATLELVDEEGSGVTASARRREAIRQLHGCTTALDALLGDDHEEVVRARGNVEVAARHAAERHAGQGAVAPRQEYQRHWQPSLGCGLAAAAPPAPLAGAGAALT